MTITIGSLTFENHLNQLVTYEGESWQGLTARKFDSQLFIHRTEFAAFIAQYNAWRDTRINDADTVASATLGTTVNVTGDFDGVTVTNLPCWYFAAPTDTEKVGDYYTVRATMIDAAQYLEVLLKSKEKQKEATDAELPNFGTFTIGGTVVTLAQRAEGFENLPQAQLTMTGNHHVTGPRTITDVRNIRGYTDLAGVVAIEAWIKAQTSADLGVGDYLPVSWVQPTAEVLIANGAKFTRYTIETRLVIL